MSVVNFRSQLILNPFTNCTCGAFRGDFSTLAQTNLTVNPANIINPASFITQPRVRNEWNRVQCCHCLYSFFFFFLLRTDCGASQHLVVSDAWLSSLLRVDVRLFAYSECTVLFQPWQPAPNAGWDDWAEMVLCATAKLETCEKCVGEMTGFDYGATNARRENR